MHRICCMCNRYSQTKRERDLTTSFSTLHLSFEPRYNIAPTNVVTVAFAEERTLHAAPMAWQFRRTDGGIVTNCKSETAHEKAFFKKAWLHRRCLIPADGFYEWKLEGARKQPYRFVLKSEEPFWFAGLWQPSAEPTRAAGSEFVILTRAATADVALLHNRMPLILRPDEIEPWLLASPIEWIPDGITEGSLRAYPVSSLVSRPGLETPDCIVPFAPEASQSELF